jgi:hypothetical protein
MPRTSLGLRKEDAMIDITVKVPEDHVAEFYRRHADWLQALTNVDGAELARREWTARDAKYADPVRDGLPDGPKAFFELIVAEGRLGEEDVVSRLGLSNPKQITGLHGWVGRVAAAFGLKSPIKAEPDSEGGAIWSIDPAVGALFQR